jgi:hypothetical protein
VNSAAYPFHLHDQVVSSRFVKFMGEPPPRRVDPRPQAPIELGLGLKTKSVRQPVQSPGDRFHRLYTDLGETEEDTSEL